MKKKPCPELVSYFFRSISRAEKKKFVFIFPALCIALTINLSARQPALSHVRKPLESEDSTSFSIIFSNKVQSPINVPVIPSLSRNTPYYFGGMVGRAVNQTDYQPYNEGAFIKTNGKSEQTYVITTGVWRLLVGDKPVIGLDLRNTSGAYASPGILPHLGVKGKIRLQVSY